MMIPLASALYVAAELAVPDKVLVDIGTGYFSEVSRSPRPSGRLTAGMCCQQQHEVLANPQYRRRGARRIVYGESGRAATAGKEWEFPVGAPKPPW